MAALLCGGLGISCQSSSEHRTASDTLAPDTTRWTTLLNASLKAFAHGDTGRALQLAEQALKLEPGVPFLYELKGYYHYTRGEDSLALRLYQQALERGGASSQLHQRIGSAYLSQRQWKLAHYHLRQALAADSTNPDIWVALGLWAYLQHRLSEAATFWKKALIYDSTHEKARTFLYDLHLNEFGEPDTAKKYYLDPYWQFNRFNPLLNFQLGNYYLKKLQSLPHDKSYERQRATYAFQAVHAYTQAILGYPSHAQAYYNRGFVYFLLGKYERALEDFVRASELNPTDARAHFMAASLFEYTGALDKACWHYERAAALPEAREALKELKGKDTLRRR
ncbi:MAG: tetratricopeptide repeat protein [Bacteroidia bacterium]|nr:tetratricopeptide repeat protein [Bacteroidia bacterium]MDW8014962.1 tetratricopeptide repeat protein [Bacteroidia bacterium]